MADIRSAIVPNKAWAVLCSLVVFVFFVMALTNCGSQSPPVEKPPRTEVATSVPAAAPPQIGSELYLAQAQFLKEKAADSDEMKVVPGPARLVIWTYQADGWVEDVIEDPDSNVFHKAAWFKPVVGEPGILTIGAQAAHLKIWRKDDTGQWVSESLWNPTFGGKFDRLRDFEVADVTGDGQEEICIATHDVGVVAVVRWHEDKYVVDEIARKPDTFVHEMEVGDVNGDGFLELFTTPSHPNKMDGSIQPGEIDMFVYDGKQWQQRIVDSLESRHAKEILCTSLTRDGRQVLLTALEGEKIGGQETGDTTRIRMYEFDGDQIKSTDIASLPGMLCRFLTIGDTDGDGKREIIASTNKDGIWRLDPPEKEGDSWKKTLVATGSSGFEHSTYTADLNSDGIDEIYVASDNQKQFRKYAWNGRGYSAEVIGPLKNDTITWNVTVRIP